MVNYQNIISFRHQITLTPSKRVLHTILLLENSMGTKVKVQKIMKFSSFRHPGTVEISCFQKKNARKHYHLAVEYTYSVMKLHFTSSKKFELNQIICERVTNKKVMILS